MLTFAFWNLRRNVAPSLLAAFAREQNVDVLVLAESAFTGTELIGELNRGTDRLYFSDPIDAGRLTLFTRFQTDKECLIRDAPYISIRHYSPPLGADILLAAIHMPSKLWAKSEDQTYYCMEVAGQIRDAEAKVKHDRTIVIGDFNMNPFEAGVVGCGGFHAIMDRSIAASGSRKVNGVVHPFFFIPMWSMFGESESHPPGTYFYNSGAPVNYFWHMFDQVLFRPSLVRFAPQAPAQIVTTVAGKSLLSENGRPEKSSASDHFPIVCRLFEILE